MTALMGLAASAVTLVACSGARSAREAATLPEKALMSPSAWHAEVPAAGGGDVIIEPSASGVHISVSSPEGQQARAVALLDASRLRNHRVMLSSRVVMTHRSWPAAAYMRMSQQRPGGAADAWDSATSKHDSGDAAVDLQAVLDVSGDATALQIELVVDGDATATFDDPKMAPVQRPPNNHESLSREQTERLQVLAWLVGYIRFFHPSDQSARADWPALEVQATDRVLGAQDTAAFRAALDWFVKTVAPTAVLYDKGHSPPSLSLPHGQGSRLTRWVRVGYLGEAYAGFRTGLDEPENVGAALIKTVASQTCKHAKVRFAGNTVAGKPRLQLYLIPRRGSGVESVISQAVDGGATIEGDVPPTAGAMSFGMQVGGEGIVDVTSLELLCGERVMSTITASDQVEPAGVGYHLYEISQTPCNGHSCIRIVRSPELDESHDRNSVDVEIGLGLRLLLPLAVWTDGKRTYPITDDSTEHFGPRSPSDRTTRLATVVDVWSTLRWFYPNFGEVRTDWDKALPIALEAAARAASANDLLAALGQLLAELHDGHASIFRIAFDDGIWPLAFHLIDNVLYLVNGIEKYASTLPRGSIVTSVNGQPANVAIDEAARRLSSATVSWRNAYLPIFMGYGPRDSFVSLSVRTPDGSERQIDVPRIDRIKYTWQLHEPRPTTGDEVAKGIFYIDLTKVDLTTWDGLVPKLTTARGLIFDVRGPTSDVIFHVLAHLSDLEMKSPYWDTPIVNAQQTRQYERNQWTITPEAPRLHARLAFVIDGRTISTSETAMQIVRAYHLGTAIGESTAASNGDVSSFETLGELRVRFTGLRTLNQDGTVFHGQGIMPQITVHPTGAGITAGKDELLDVAIKQVQN